ncbi:acyl-CoA N-acyltransferase [Xylariales sp. PMI_506]|nr:acyl-CoA N-acyltransferase [Xylariales sp. PMI_506]
MSRIEIREAQYSDLPRAAHVLAQAFGPDNLFGELIHPYRKEFPNDSDLYWLRRIRVDYWNFRDKLFVATTKEEESGNEVIRGNLLRPIVSAVMKLNALVWPNRACDPEKEDILERGFPHFAHVWSGNRAESWYLAVLGVHPDYQGKGIGRVLVQWGLQRAQEEGICASVAASRGKDGFYTRCGFDIQDGSVCDGDANPLSGVEGGNLHWRMPRTER